MQSPRPTNLARPLVYSTDQIHERRLRILKETRAMIAERGIDGFSVRELSKRANVALRTLYNAFGGKDRMIALAIKEAHVNALQYIEFHTSADTLDGVLNRAIEINKRNFSAKNYALAVVSIYFAARTHKDIWSALHEMAFANLRGWFQKMEQDNSFQDWVKPEELANDFINLEYSIINDWAQGRIKDQDYVRRQIEGILRNTVSATKGRVNEEAVAHLIRIRKTGQLPHYEGATRSSAKRAARKSANA